ncbi:lipopolysaccharide assembly LapA domain-containing protein [Virgibacillus kekensis]|uniref:Lipopolysaccharide assembly LapA domain-containing protein n=1 Tax=Virgibacillus kekensis TaxID=202261 RepID=A0ABV9DKS4_9BACI
MKGQSYVILSIIFIIVVAIFAVINVEPVQVDYLFGSGQAPLILVILFSVLMGGIITAAAGIVKVINLQRERKSLRSENKHLKEKLEKNQPLSKESPVNPTSPKQTKEEGGGSKE